jgi:hypothetical protein
VTAVALKTAPTGTVTDGSYPLFLTQGSNTQAVGLEVTFTVTNGQISVAVLNGGAHYQVEDTLTVFAGWLPGATGNATAQVTAISNPAAVALPATDIDHYTVLWAPSGTDISSPCTPMACLHGPWNEVAVPATVLTYTIPAACGVLEIDVETATTLTALMPAEVSSWATVIKDTGLACPLDGVPGTSKLSWVKP